MLIMFLKMGQFIFLFLMQMEAGKLTLINSGSNSQIYRFGDEQKGVILKAVPVSCTRQVNHLLNEYKMLSTMDHQNIIKVLKYKQRVNLQGSSKNVLVIENAYHGSLLDFYKKGQLKINQIRWIFAELTEAIQYLHCNYIVHRDLKLENVLVCQNESQIQIKLADFGFATSTKQSHESNAFKGTKRGFMAPEIHRLSKNPLQLYDMYKCDIFSLGVILFTLVMGRLPWQYASSQNALYRLIQKKSFRQFWSLHSSCFQKIEEQEGSLLDQFKEFFQQMVHPDASKRPTIQQVLECSWLQGKQQIIKSIKRNSE